MPKYNTNMSRYYSLYLHVYACIWVYLLVFAYISCFCFFIKNFIKAYTKVHVFACMLYICACVCIRTSLCISVYVSVSVCMCMHLFVLHTWATWSPLPQSASDERLFQSWKQVINTFHCTAFTEFCTSADGQLEGPVSHWLFTWRAGLAAVAVWTWRQGRTARSLWLGQYCGPGASTTYWLLTWLAAVAGLGAASQLPPILLRAGGTQRLLLAAAGQLPPILHRTWTLPALPWHP